MDRFLPRLYIFPIILGASFFVICLHATFYNFDALDLMDDQQELTGSIVEEVWSCKKKKEKKINILSF